MSRKGCACAHGPWAGGRPPPRGAGRERQAASRLDRPVGNRQLRCTEQQSFPNVANPSKPFAQCIQCQVTLSYAVQGTLPKSNAHVPNYGTAILQGHVAAPLFEPLQLHGAPLGPHKCDDRCRLQDGISWESKCNSAQPRCTKDRRLGYSKQGKSAQQHATTEAACRESYTVGRNNCRHNLYAKIWR